MARVAQFTNTTLVSRGSQIMNPGLFVFDTLEANTKSWISRIDELAVPIQFSEMRPLNRNSIKGTHQKTGLYVVYCIAPKDIEMLNTGFLDLPIVSENGIYVGQSSSNSPSGGILKRLSQLICTIKTKPLQTAMEEIFFPPTKNTGSETSKQHAAGKKFIMQLTSIAEKFKVSQQYVLESCLYYRVAEETKDWVVSPEYHEMALLTAYALNHPDKLFNNN